MITKNPMVNWTYSKSHQGFHNLIDPRTAIARQLNWQRSTSNITEYTLPEPENYNRAVYSPRPIEFTWVKFQVIYKDTYRNAWITACHLTAEESAKFDAWAQANDMTHWRHHKPRSLRHRKLLLERGATKAEISLDERLLTMGYYKNMVVKYFDGDAHIVKSRLGEARACLADLFNDE